MMLCGTPLDKVTPNEDDGSLSPYLQKEQHSDSRGDK